jgi:hypothetical protein
VVVAVDLVCDDPEGPDIVAESETALLDHVGAEVGWTAPQETFSADLLELVGVGEGNAIEICNFGKALNNG